MKGWNTEVLKDQKNRMTLGTGRTQFKKTFEDGEINHEKAEGIETHTQGAEMKDSPLQTTKSWKSDAGLVGERS